MHSLGRCILILSSFAIAKLLRMSYTERNSSIKFANLFRFGISLNKMPGAKPEISIILEYNTFQTIGFVLFLLA